MSLVRLDVPFTPPPTLSENHSNILTLLQIFVTVSSLDLWQVICGFFNLEDCSTPFLQIYRKGGTAHA